MEKLNPKGFWFIIPLVKKNICKMKSRFQKGNTQKTRSAFFFGVFTQTTNLKASQSNPQNSSKVRS